MSLQYRELRPIAAAIVSLVWDAPTNFNGFRVLAALLHDTPVVGVSKTAKLYGIEHRAPPIFGRAANTLGIGPHYILVAHILVYYLLHNRTHGTTKLN